MVNEWFRYLSVSQKDREWGLYVAAAGYSFGVPRDCDWVNHPEPYRFRWSDGRQIDLYAVNLSIRGVTEFESESTGRILVEPGSLIVTFAGEPHRYRAAAQDTMHHYWVWFGGGYARHLVEKCCASPSNPILATGRSVPLQASYRAVFDRLESEPLGFKELAAANILEILALASRLARQQQALDPCRSLIRDAEEVLKSRLDRPLNLQHLAQSLGFDYDHFRHVFRQKTGLSPYQYRLRLRLDRAGELLRAAPMSVKEISESLGFADPHQFSKLFKKHVGVSPCDYRMRAEGGYSR